MTTIEIIAQAIGILAMAMNCLSYQQKSKKGVLTFQFFGSALFAINFFMLKAYSGAFLNAIGIIRALIFLKKDKSEANKPIYLILFSVAYVASYIMIFTIFGKEPSAVNLIIEILPVIAMILSTISFRFVEAKMIRRYGLFSSPLWLIYNIVNMNIGAILCEVFNLVSMVVGIIRFDIKKESHK